MNEPARLNIPEWTVSQLSAALRRTVEDAFGYVRVRGEVSGFRGPHSSGHCYFALKDEGAKIEAVIFRSARAHAHQARGRARSPGHRTADDSSRQIDISDHHRDARARGDRRADGAC